VRREAIQHIKSIAYGLPRRCAPRNDELIKLSFIKICCRYKNYCGRSFAVLSFIEETVPHTPNRCADSVFGLPRHFVSRNDRLLLKLLLKQM
jgi:hypothetical protein